uniref:Uncharacterized protein n=1 Tax=Rhodosorus marinus TaxID=101924 RepID=A0A7S3E993_9RHOD|mmetsp:Transcript_18950/g.76055  ORF Transcript_18950/g.76055 Transcript_18950/m.76055 type:complete len:544 (+) Transcript_18950:2806-4437(+)
MVKTLCAALLVVSLYAVHGEFLQTLNVSKLQELLPFSEDPAHDNMGHYTRIYGDVIIAGAYGNNNWRGKIYVFEKNAQSGLFEPLQELVASHPMSLAYLGLNIDIWEDTIVGGAPYEEPLGEYRSGAVYVWQKGLNGLYQLSQRLVPWDSQRSGFYGYSVAIEGNRLVVGARFTKNEVDNIARAGKIYVYERVDQSSPFELVQQLRGVVPRIHWADELRLRGDVLLAGAPRAYDGEGAAYVFHRIEGEWIEIQEFRVDTSNGVPADVNAHFGEGIAISSDGSYIVVAGERRDSVQGENTGGAQLYERVGNQWQFKQHLEPPRRGNLRFGQRLVAKGNFIFVGAWTSPEIASGAGAVYIYAKDVDGIFKLSNTVVNPMGQENDNFGKMLDVTEHYLVVGAPKENQVSAVDSGVVHVYSIEERDGCETTYVPTPTPMFDDFLGFVDDVLDVKVGLNEIGLNVISVEAGRVVQVRLQVLETKKILGTQTYPVEQGRTALVLSVPVPEGVVESGEELQLRIAMFPEGYGWSERVIPGLFAFPKLAAF